MNVRYPPIDILMLMNNDPDLAYSMNGSDFWGLERGLASNRRRMSLVNMSIIDVGKYIVDDR